MRGRRQFLQASFGVAAVARAATAVAAQPAVGAGTPGEADPGVRPTRLIDRDEIRVSRVELQPGAVRSVHAHDDVEYHVWAPVEGSLEITIGTDQPVAATSGQAFFLKRGTRHGFRNTGTTPAAVFEIFVKKSMTSADRTGPDDPRQAGALALEQVLAMFAPR